MLKYDLKSKDFFVCGRVHLYSNQGGKKKYNEHTLPDHKTLNFRAAGKVSQLTGGFLAYVRNLSLKSFSKTFTWFLSCFGFRCFQGSW